LSKDDRPAENNQSDDAETFVRKLIAVDPQRGLEMLFRWYYKPLCSHAARFVHSKAIAEDIVADVFYQFWIRQTYRQITGCYRSYLFAVVRHRAYAHLRAELNRTQVEVTDDLAVFTSAPNPEQILQYDELYLRIEKAIVEISPQSRKAFLMSRLEGKKYQEIAEEMNITQKAVEAHISKALRRLRAVLKYDSLISVLLLAVQLC
jgi:RNA polymerase sigma-70 factor (ECF subfamily)